MSADNNREFALSWLRLAEEDLKSARKLLSPPDPIWETAVYHCPLISLDSALIDAARRAGAQIVEVEP